MVLQVPVSEESLLRSTRLHVDTRYDKIDTNQTNFRYRVKLKEPANNVVSALIGNFSGGKDFAPTFYEGVSGGQTGNNKLDFRLQNFDVDSGAPTTFSVTLPSNTFYYFDGAHTNTDSLTRMLQSVMQNAIDANATWAGNANIVVQSHPEQRTLITVGNSPDLLINSSTELTLLFSSGVNSENNPASVLGFTSGDKVSAANASIAYGNFTTQSIISEGGVNLELSPYLDINIEQFRYMKPMKRVYLGVEQSLDLYNDPGSIHNEVPMSISTQEPPRNLEFLDITITFRGDINPESYGLTNTDHSFSVTLVQLQDCPLNVPKYMKHEYLV